MCTFLCYFQDTIYEGFDCFERQALILKNDYPKLKFSINKTGYFEMYSCECVCAYRAHRKGMKQKIASWLL